MQSHTEHCLLCSYCLEYKRRKITKTTAIIFFFDIMFYKKEDLKISSFLVSTYIIRDSKVILSSIIMFKFSKHRNEFSKIYNLVLNKLHTL